jgi:hypothetical protein
LSHACLAESMTTGSQYHWTVRVMIELYQTHWTQQLFSMRHDILVK